MGGQSSTIDTLTLPLSALKTKTLHSQNTFSPPLRKYGPQDLLIEQRKMVLVLQIEEPQPEKIRVQEEIFEDLEDAFDLKTRDILIDSVLVDEEYSDMRIYQGRQGDKQLALRLRNFNGFNSYAFNNIMYEVHMSQEIGKLKCPYLNTITDRYIVQTGLEVQGQQCPNTQVLILQPIATNLSEIIRYRRQNNWAWTTSQFNALTSDLVNAVIALHNGRISHNDIRPCNVYFSLERNCYQLGSFSNAVKSYTTAASMRESRSMAASQIRGSVYYGAPELSTTLFADLEQADIYSLGITLLCAFYLCQPINLSVLPAYNKQYEKSYAVMSVLQEMIMPVTKRASIQVLSKRIPESQRQYKMKNLIESLRYKNVPKGKTLVQCKKIISEAYQRLGLWNEWKQHQNEAFQLQEPTLDDFKKANSLHELAKIEFCRGDSITSSEYAKSASSIYRTLGYTAYDQGNINQSLNLFTKAIECSKYYENGNDMDTARNLQGLALIHAEKSQYQISKPLINEASHIVSKNLGKQSIDYCKIKMSEAKIQSDFGQFQLADKILHECLSISDKKAKTNEESALKLKAQILHEIGRNAMLQSSYTADPQQVLINKAQRYLGDSLSINEKFADSKLELASNFQTFGQIELRRHNYVGAKMNFKKVEQLRAAHTAEKDSTRNTMAVQREHAQMLCNIAACENGIQNYQQAIKLYNEALVIYRGLYGSDHNKLSAMAIGNMSKIYFKVNDMGRAKECLMVATQILEDLLGAQDPDYQHFKNLQDSL